VDSARVAADEVLGDDARVPRARARGLEQRGAESGRRSRLEADHRPAALLRILQRPPRFDALADDRTARLATRATSIEKRVSRLGLDRSPGCGGNSIGV
jgi:hypothetical protein